MAGLERGKNNCCLSSGNTCAESAAIKAILITIGVSPRSVGFSFLFL